MAMWHVGVDCSQGRGRARCRVRLRVTEAQREEATYVSMHTRSWVDQQCDFLTVDQQRQDANDARARVGACTCAGSVALLPKARLHTPAA